MAKNKSAKVRNDVSTKAKKTAKVKKKVAKKTAVKKERVPKTRNAGTQTEASFWSMISSGLRKMSMYWKPILKARLKARRAYKGDNRRQLWEYECNHCKNWFKNDHIVVDHITPVGVLRSYEDLPRVVEILFCEEDNLQVLCKNCHLEKTNAEIKELTRLKNEIK